MPFLLRVSLDPVGVGPQQGGMYNEELDALTVLGLIDADTWRPGVGI